MSAIVGYAGQGGEAALRAILAAADGTGITTAMQTASSAGLAVTGVNPVIFRDGPTLSAVAGTLAPAVASPAADLATQSVTKTCIPASNLRYTDITPGRCACWIGCGASCGLFCLYATHVK